MTSDTAGIDAERASFGALPEAALASRTGGDEPGTMLRRAVTNGTLMLMSQVITWTATLVLTGVLARHLGDAGFGDLYLAASFALLFGVLVSFGQDQQLTRAISRDRALTNRYVATSLVIKTVTAAVSYALIAGVTILLAYPANLRAVILIFALVLFFNGYSGTLTAAFQGQEFMLPSALATIVEKVSVAVVATLLVMHGYGVASVAATTVAGASLNLAVQTTFFLRVIRPRWPGLDPSTVRTLVIGALPFFFYWVFGSVYYRIDSVLLSKMAGPATVGWYGAAYRLFDTLVFLPNIMSATIMLPILSRLSVGSQDDFRAAVNRGLQLIAVAGLPICAGLFVLSGPIVTLVYGRPEFLHAVPALRWLAAALFVLYLNSILGVTLISLNQERKLTLAAALAIALNLASNLLLIPRYQHVAAAATTFLTELFLLSFLLWNLPRDVFERRSGLVIGKAFAASLVMSAGLLLARGQSLLVLVPLGGCLYAVAALALGVLTPAELRQLTRRKPPGEAMVAPSSIEVARFEGAETEHSLRVGE